MDEAQRELERAGQQERDDEDDDEEREEELKGYGGDAERRSVREGDVELLEGAEALDVEGVPPAGVGEGLIDKAVEERGRSGSEAEGKVVEFER